ncbi:MAG: hypothetical protein OJF49_001287 [Ktedonobacterales bacterium]|jgi:hypothetical protein|nr:MAG: hypothetical protein OJF49_001287 [Ktedonobacterales bacterium]
MSINAQPRTKNHFSVNLRIRRPRSLARLVVLALALLQTILLYLTLSSAATSGGLYGCPMPCGTADKPGVPAFGVILGVVILALALAIGALCQSWAGAIVLAALPWLITVILRADLFLVPTAVFETVKSTTRNRAPTLTGHFGQPFWLDTTHLWQLLLSLALFAALGWFGWLARQAISDL